MKYVDLSHIHLFEGLSFEYEKINNTFLFLFDDISFKEFLNRLSKGYKIVSALGIDKEDKKCLEDFINVLNNSQFCDITITYYLDTGDIDFNINNDDLAICYEALLNENDYDYLWFNLK